MKKQIPDINRQCMRSGFCCLKAPCQFGEPISDTVFSCKFLEVEKVLQDKKTKVYRCGKYEEIKKIPGSDISPAFGAGCCQPLFNENRDKIILLTLFGGIADKNS